MHGSLKAVPVATPPATDSTLDSLVMGMGAIGDLLRVAGANEDQSLQPFTVAQVGDLLCFMSAEMQRLREGA